MKDNETPSKKIGHTKEIFEEKFGNMENFSRQAVGSLFEDDKPQTDPHETPEPAKPPYKRINKNAEAEYEAYLNSASAENQREMAKRQAEKEAAIARRESHLSELPKSRKQLEEEFTDLDLEKVEVSRISQAAGNRNRQVNKAWPPLNYRNIAAAGLAVFLVILMLMVWWLVSMNSRLNNATTELDELQGRNDALELEIAGLEMELEQLGTPGHMQNQNQENPLHTQPQETTTAAPDSTPAAQTTPAPQQGPIIHVVQPGETLSAISRIHFGDTSRVADIQALNNIADPDDIGAGNELMIPHP